MRTPSTWEPREGPFATTLWSMIMRLDTPSGDAAHLALVDLSLRYWCPVYAYVRRCGHAPDAAHGISRAFFESLLLERAPIVRTNIRFRHYLLKRLNHFLAEEWSGAASDGPPEEGDAARDDLERRCRSEVLGTGSPEQTFRRSFALELLARALVRLRDEATEARQSGLHDALVPLLALDPVPGELEDIAHRMGKRVAIVDVALAQLRRRFRELVGVELADTVASAEEWRTERQALHDALLDRE